MGGENNARLINITYYYVIVTINLLYTNALDSKLCASVISEFFLFLFLPTNRKALIYLT